MTAPESSVVAVTPVAATTDPDLDLDAIQERADNASEGPWIVYLGDTWYVHSADYSEGVAAISGEHDGNAIFIAAARTDVPALVAEVRRLRAQLDSTTERLRAALGTP